MSTSSQKKSSFFSQYKGVAAIFRDYWHAYGGSQALLKSPYFHCALILLLPLTASTWLAPDWWNDPISVLPNLLGFSLAGFAIFIGFGDNDFRELMATPDRDDNGPTVYLAVCATFVHFIVVQVLAFLYAFLSKGLFFYCKLLDPIRDSVLPVLNWINGAVGYGLFIYALVSIVAATMHVFRIAKMYSSFIKAKQIAIAKARARLLGPAAD